MPVTFIRDYLSLGLLVGLDSATSIGYTSVTDPVTTYIDFIAGTLKVMDDGGQSGYLIEFPALKSGGTFVESSLSDGRLLLSANNDNVTETIYLMAAGAVADRISALNDLLNTARLLHDYETSQGVLGKIVALEVQVVGTRDPQYSRVRKMEISSDADYLSALDAGAFTGITLSIERDPYWQEIPPSANPKIYAFLKRGLRPSTVSGAPAASQYNHTNLPLTVFGGAANYQQLIEGTVFNFDEAGTANVDYIDIPAASIPGDAPALAYIYHGSGLNARTRLWVARSTIRDMYPATNDNSTSQRLRNTWNGAEATISTFGGVTTTHQVDAVNGLLYVGGGVNRRVMRMVLAAAGSTAGVGGGAWSRINSYTRSWNVFLRMRITAGTPANVTMVVYVRESNTSYYAVTLSRALAGYTATANWFTFYMGRIDLGSILKRDISTGLGTLGQFLTMSVSATKTNDALAATVEIADMVFLPLDEPIAQIDRPDAFPFYFASLDSTGYINPSNQNTVITDSVAGGLGIAPVYGQPITLLPNVANRLYFVFAAYAGVLNPTTSYPVSVNIIPRWNSPRRSLT